MVLESRPPSLRMQVCILFTWTTGMIGQHNFSCGLRGGGVHRFSIPGLEIEFDLHKHVDVGLSLSYFTRVFYDDTLWGIEVARFTLCGLFSVALGWSLQRCSVPQSVHRFWICSHFPLRLQDVKFIIPTYGILEKNESWDDNHISTCMFDNKTNLLSFLYVDPLTPCHGSAWSTTFHPVRLQIFDNIGEV